jgi:hypothetical protein
MSHRCKSDLYLCAPNEAFVCDHSDESHTRTIELHLVTGSCFALYRRNGLFASARSKPNCLAPLILQLFYFGTILQPDKFNDPVNCRLVVFSFGQMEGDVVVHVDRIVSNYRDK